VEVHGSGPHKNFVVGVLYGLDPTKSSSFLYHTLGTIFMPVVLLYFNVGYSVIHCLTNAEFAGMKPIIARC
jgi:hypothetical protein